MSASKASSLVLAAGDNAYARLQEQGFRPELVQGMLAASGGPKGLMLLQLDRYLTGEFLSRSRQPIDVLGTSIGSWRMACYTQARPLEAIDRFEEMYLSQSFSAKPDRHEITCECERLLDGILGRQGVHEIAANPRYRLHVIASRGKGAAASESGGVLGLSFALLAAANVLSPRAPFWFYERVMFRHEQGAFPWHDSLQLAGEVTFTPDNVREVLMASAAIPLVINGVQDIPGAPAGIYRDGGLTDYHLSMPMAAHEGIVLYPHFFPRVVPGWFDKSLAWRVPNPQDFANVLLLAPSQHFIDQLPYGRIPDRKDFNRLSPGERVHYWRKVLDQTRRMVDELDDLISTDGWRAALKPLRFSRYGAVEH